MVVDVKSGGVNEKLLNEVVEYWVKTPLKPDEIGEFYKKQMEQLATVSAPKVGKASNSESFTDADIASKMAGETQFDAPDVDNSKDEKIANASADKNFFNYLDFASMLVTNPSNVTGKGSPRRLLQ